MLEPHKLVKSEYANREVHELLSCSVTALLGVNEASAHLLEHLEIFTVFDLATSRVFGSAHDIVCASEDPHTLFARYKRFPADTIDRDVEDQPIESLPGLEMEKLSGIGPNLGPSLSVELDLQTIRDVARWPPFQAARRILDHAFQTESDDDPEAPAELLPTAGNFPTERTFYSVVVLNTTDSQGSSAADLAEAGQIDIMANPKQFGFSKPATGAILTYAQSWYSHGLSLGQLLHSLALAPGESTRVAVIDWSRRDRASVEEETTQVERLDSSMLQKRGISEVTSATAQECQWGFSNTGSLSSAVTGGFAAGGLGPGVLGIWGGGLGESANATTAYSVAKSGGRRDLSARMSQNIMNSTQQNASASRTRRASVIREVSQEESEQISTRVITNYNHMHALSVHYYEVIQIYRVATQLEKCERCLFVPMKPIDFSDVRIISRYRAVLVAAADTEYIRSLLLLAKGTVQLHMILPRAYTLNIPSDDSKAAAIKAAKKRAKERTILRATLADASRAAGVNIGHDPDGPMCLPADTELINICWDEDESDPKTVCRCFVYRESEEDVAQPWTLEKSGDPQDHRAVNPGFAPAPTPPPAVSRTVSTEPERTAPAPTPAPTPAHAPAVSRIASIGLERTQPCSDDRRYRIRLNFRYLQDRYFSLSFDCAFPKDKTSVTLIRCLNEANTDELIQALNENSLYYSQQIWLNADPQTVATLLADYAYPNAVRIAEYIDPRPVAVHGNYLAFRWHYEDDSWRDWMEAKYDGGTRIDFARVDQELVALPTGGTFAEAVLGRYNSAEKLDISRFWNWQDSPIPIQAPEIAPIAAGSRFQKDTTETASLEQPIINIQVPPSLPEPTSLSSIINALTASNMFRDMSGLAQTIALAERSLLSAAEGAVAGASQAGANMATAGQYLVESQKVAAQLLAALLSAYTGVPIPMADSKNNISNVGATLNAAKEVDDQKKHSLPLPLEESGLESSRAASSSPAAGSSVGSGGSGGDIGAPGGTGVASSGSLHEAGLGTWMGQPSSSAALDYGQGSLAFGEPESEGRAEHRVEDEFRVYVNMRGQGNIGERIGNPQLIASIYFETNKHKVDAEGLTILRDIAHYSKRNWRLTLRGYADFTGEAEHNQRLSMYRAEDVESWLQLYRDEYDESHIMYENIIPVGMGAREKNIAYSLDRVVEIYLELVESEPIDENIIEQQISDLQNVLSEHDLQEARAKCILEKCRDRLKTYVLGQQPEMNELFFTVVGAYNYCHDELWRKPGHVDSTRRKHGTSILEELTVRVILPEVDLQEKVQLLVMLDTRIATGITQLDTQMSGVGSVRYSEEAAIHLARFILDRNEDQNDFYSCYAMKDTWRSILGR